MSITRGNTTFASGESGDVTVTVPSGVADGDVLVFTYAKYSGAGYTPGSWSFDFGTWNTTTLATDTGSLHSGIAALVVADASALPSTITGGFSGGTLRAVAGSLTVYTGVDNASPFTASENEFLSLVTGGTLPALDVAQDGSKYVGFVVQGRQNTLTFDTLTRFNHDLAGVPVSTDDIRHAVADGDVSAGTSVSVGGWTSSDAQTRLASQSGMVLNPAATADQLATPTSFTFAKTAGTTEVVGSWNTVTDADTYDYEVEEWDGSAWQTFASGATTDPTSTFTLDGTDGVTYSTLYRARVRAVPAV